MLVKSINFVSRSRIIFRLFLLRFISATKQLYYLSFKKYIDNLPASPTYIIVILKASIIPIKTVSTILLCIRSHLHFARAAEVFISVRFPAPLYLTCCSSSQISRGREDV